MLREEDGEEAVVGVLEPGAMFGEMAIIEKETRSATVRALTSVRALTIDRNTFLRRVQEDPSLAFQVLKTMSERLRRLDAELAKIKAAIGAGTGRRDEGPGDLRASRKKT